MDHRTSTSTSTSLGYFTRALLALAIGAVCTLVISSAPVNAEGMSSWAKLRLAGDNTLNVFVGAGDSVRVRAAVEETSPNGEPYQVRMTRLGGVSSACTLADTLGSTCTLGPLAAAAEGVWAIEVVEASADADPGSNQYSVEVTVRGPGGEVVSGRTWAPEGLHVANPAPNTTAAQVNANAADVSLFYLDDRGFLYNAAVRGYNGLSSRLYATHLGIVDATGAPRYESTQGLPAGWSLGGPGNKSYKVFFEQPAADLPAEATYPDGSVRAVSRVASPLLPSLSAFDWVPGDTATHAGQLNWTVADYDGPMTVTLDTNLDGDFTGADRQFETNVQADVSSSLTWDGLDAASEEVDADESVAVRLTAPRYGEIHFIFGDVERRDAISVQRLNGPNPGSQTLYWNDTTLGLGPENRSITAQPDGRGGVPSGAGVHDLPISPGADPLQGWGNERLINDWTYVDEPVHLSGTIPPITPRPRALQVDLDTAANTSTDGQRITYTITARNAGWRERDVEVENILLSELTGDGAEAFAVSKGAFDTASMTWRIGTMGRGDVESMKLTLSVVESAEPTDTGATNAAIIRSRKLPRASATDCQPNATGVASDEDQCDRLVVTSAPRELQIDNAVTQTHSKRGDKLVYTLTARNAGERTERAVVLRDYPVSGLDAASVRVLNSEAGTFDPDTLSWRIGALDPGETKQLKLSYTSSEGMGATSPGPVNMATIRSKKLPEPNRDDCQANTEVAADTDRCDTTSLPVGPRLRIKKTADYTEVRRPGDVVTYTVTATNVGKAPFTADMPAVVRDDLTGVLDDGTLMTSSVEANRQPVPTYDSSGLSWSGALGVGETLKYSYDVFYDKNTGDRALVSVAYQPVTPGVDQTPGCVEVTTDGTDTASGHVCARTYTPVEGLIATVSVTPDDGGPVAAGDVLTYRVLFENRGTGPASARYRDLLEGILDDAKLVSRPVSDSPGVRVFKTADHPDRYRYRVELAAGASAQVTYRVRVRSDLNDAIAKQYIVRSDMVEPWLPCALTSILCTRTPLASYTVTTTVQGGTPGAGPGDRLSYRVVVHNDGKYSYDQAHPAQLRVAMDDLLDDARYADDLHATRGDANLTQNTVQWSGPLPVGADAVITFSVVVRPQAAQGNRHARTHTRVWPGSGGQCSPRSPAACGKTHIEIGQHLSSQRDSESDTPDQGGEDATHTTGERGVLPDTGGPALWLLAVALLTIAAGMALTRDRGRK